MAAPSAKTQICLGAEHFDEVKYKDQADTNDDDKTRVSETWTSEDEGSDSTPLEEASCVWAKHGNPTRTNHVIVILTLEDAKAHTEPMQKLINEVFGGALLSLAVSKRKCHVAVDAVVCAGFTGAYSPWPDSTWEHSAATQMLLQALQFDEHIRGRTARLCCLPGIGVRLDYLSSSSDKICWEFLSQGYCPRPSCHWVHAEAMEFVISITIQQPAFETPPTMMVSSGCTPCNMQCVLVPVVPQMPGPVPVVGEVHFTPQSKTSDEAPKPHMLWADMEDDF